MKNCLLLLFGLLCQLASSQNCNSTYLGEVKDFHDGSALYGATVYIEELDKYVSTDDNGKFKFHNLCNGQITLVISHIGCETKKVLISISGDTFGTINLEHHSEELDHVVLKGQSGIKKTTTAQETVLKQETLEDYSSGSLGDALQEVSGVSSINTGNTIVKPVINGLHSSRIVIITNGVRLQDQEWGIEHAPNIDINTAESVSVIKGSGALAYSGDAIGGVVVLNPTRSIAKDSLFGKTIITGQTNGKGGSISTSLTKTFKNGWFVSGQGSYKQFGDFETPDYSLTNTGLKTKAFSIQSGYKKFEKGFDIFYSLVDNSMGILSASHIGNIEDLVNAINTPRPLTSEDFSYDINNPKQEVTHQLLKAKFYKRFESLGKLSLQYDYQHNQRFEFDKRVGDDRNKPAVDLTLQTQSLNADFKFDANKERLFHVGGLFRYQDNFANPETGVRRLIPDYQKIDVGAFITSEWSLGDATVLDAGIRYDFNSIDAKKFYLKSRWDGLNYNIDFSDIILIDYPTQWLVNPRFDYHNISASAGVKHSLSNKSSVIFNYNLANRSPNPAELFSDGLHHSAGRIELGSLRIKQEKSHRFSGTLLYNNGTFSAITEAYYNVINDFIYIEPTGAETTIRGSFPVWEYKQTNASLMGIDITLGYQLHQNWSLSNKSSYIKGDDTKNNRPLIDIPSFKTTTVLNFQKNKWKNFKCGLKSEYVARQTEYPNNNFVQFIATTNTNVLVDISTTPSAYHVLHFTSSISLNITKKTPVKIGFNINNLLNTSYRNNLNRLRYFADDLGRNMMMHIKINY